MKLTPLQTILLLCLMVCWPTTAGAAEPMGSAFTYQGHLYDANHVADSLYDFQFKLYNDPCLVGGGTEVGETVTIGEVDVVDGYFTVQLDGFYPIPYWAFNGDARWLEIGVRPGDQNDPCQYSILSPRQEITASPYAFYALRSDYAQSAGSVAGMIDGSGTTNYIPKFTASGTLGDSVIYESIATGNVGIGTSGPGDKLDVNGHINTSQTYKLDGITVLTSPEPNSIFVGEGAGASITTGRRNTAMGYKALACTNTGEDNTAVGYYALENNTEGNYNSAMGYCSLSYNTNGWYNSAVGYWALHLNTTGGNNSAMGNGTLSSNTEGDNNTAVGSRAGYSVVTGSGNVFLGHEAGYDETGSNKLYIANSSADPPLIYGEFDTGKVGIDTNNPGAKLHIGGTAGVDGLMFPDGTLQTTAAAGDGDITAVNAGTGLYGGGTSGDVTLDIEVPLTLTGTSSIPLLKITNNGSGYGIEARSSGPRGVYAEATGTGGTSNYGGYFKAAGNLGRAVYGYATAVTDANNYGGYFIAQGDQGKGVYASATGANGVGVYGKGSNGSKAAHFEGDVHVTGEITKAFTANTNNPATPIAYAYVAASGVHWGTPNVTGIVWNSTEKRYEITISGQTYTEGSYVTNVTARTDVTPPYIATCLGLDGKLMVTLYQLTTGLKTQGYFQFITYKP